MVTSAHIFSKCSKNSVRTFCLGMFISAVDIFKLFKAFNPFIMQDHQGNSKHRNRESSCCQAACEAAACSGVHDCPAEEFCLFSEWPGNKHDHGRLRVCVCLCLRVKNRRNKIFGRFYLHIWHVSVNMKTSVFTVYLHLWEKAETESSLHKI